MRIRTASVPGDPAKPNEDFVVTVEGFVAVLDGVSIPDGLDSGCVHGPAWYTRRLGVHLVTAHTDDPDADLRHVLRNAIAAVRDSHANTCDLTRPGTPQATLALLRANDQGCDYLVLGDASIVLDTGTTPTVITDRRMLGFAHDLRRRALDGSAAIGSTQQDDRIRALTIAKWDHVNQPHGYWIAAANPAAAEHAIHGHLPLHGPGRLRRGALLTDGSSCVVDPFQLTTWTGLLDLLHTDGPHAAVTLARHGEHADPHRSRSPRAKTHDDATVAYCHVTPEQP